MFGVSAELETHDFPGNGIATLFDIWSKDQVKLWDHAEAIMGSDGKNDSVADDGVNMYNGNAKQESKTPIETLKKFGALVFGPVRAIPG